MPRPVDWPGRTMLMRGNEGVAGRVLQTENSIGYAEFGFAQRLNLEMAELQNASGAFVAPSIASGEAALAGSAAEMPENLRLFIADPAGPDSYPIATFSWLLLYAGYPDARRGDAVPEQFVRWGLTPGPSPRRVNSATSRCRSPGGSPRAVPSPPGPR